MFLDYKTSNSLSFACAQTPFCCVLLIILLHNFNVFISYSTIFPLQSKQKFIDKKKKQQQKDETKAARPAVKELVPPPNFLAEREALWVRCKAERDEWLAAQKREPITITLPDGKEVSGESWSTTPYEVAAGISKGLADNSVVSKVNGELWDLDRPLEGSCSLSLIKFDDDEGQAVFWHSSAHVLGEAMEKVYGGHLCYGPPIESGFYYDMFSDEYRVRILESMLSRRITDKELSRVIQIARKTQE